MKSENIPTIEMKCEPTGTEILSIPKVSKGKELSYTSTYNDSHLGLISPHSTPVSSLIDRCRVIGSSDDEHSG